MMGVALLLAAFPVAAGTPPHGPVALRNLAVAPQFTLSFGYGWTVRDGRNVFRIQSDDMTGEIHRLQSVLKEQPGDVRKMVELAELLNDTAETTNAARAAWQDVEKICRQRLEVGDDSLLLNQLGEALDNLDRFTEAESDYRRAVLISSNDWKCWASLGNFLQDRAYALLLPQQLARNFRPSPNPVPQALLDYHPPPDALQQCEAMCGEAGRCLDRVAALAPKEPDARVQLAIFLCASNEISCLIAHFKGEDKPPLDSSGIVKSFLCPAGLAEIKQAAELYATNYALIGAASFLTVLEQRMLRSDVSQESLRESVREEILLLQNLGRRPDKQTAAGALATLGVVQLMLGDKPGAHASSREALADDPLLDTAWELLLGTTDDKAPPDELVALCESRLKQVDSARNHLFLARAFLRQEKPEKAVEQAQTVLKTETNNVTAYLILTAADLRRSDNPRFMVAAEEDLQRATELWKAMPAGEESSNRWREITLNLAIWDGLQDDPGCRETAINCVRAVLQQRPDDQTAKDILHALE
jgi:tetratricopeptide (TPR) repeat protein